MTRALLSTVAAACVALPSTAADAQENEIASFALNRFEPAPAGDRFFGVQSPFAAGDPFELHAMLLFDYAHNPLVLVRTGDSTDTIGGVVEHQLFGHLNVSAALFGRLNINLDAPLALYQGGDFNDGSTPAPGGAFTSPDSAQFGDLRAGLRLRLFGEYDEIFQVAVGGYVWLPTGASDSFVGDGSVRGLPQLIVGGRSESLVWTFAGGPELRGTKNVGNVNVGTKFTFGGGVGFLAAEGNLQIGPEVTAAINLSEPGARNTNAEGLLGVRYRFARDFEIGGGPGLGFTTGVGTPDFRGVLMLAFTPEQKKADTDGDGILDDVDACKTVPGVASNDPMKHGCPEEKPVDTDKDGIPDPQDACPKEPGPKSSDPKKNGCPLPKDRDGDGILDEVDACADVPGEANEDPAKNGCPKDTDEDGIPDKDDACPEVKGVPSEDKSKHGCPPDTDGDGITDDKDACPNEKGKPDPDPTKNGCPTAVRVTEGEIVILQQVQFDTNKATIKPASDDLLDQVAGVLKEHPEITKIEIQGHTDSRGGKALNTRLSDNRAKSVREALVKRGVEESRLDAKGYGPDVPIGDNKTEEGRQANRRVQFKIIDKKPKAEAAPTPAPTTPAPKP